MNSRAAILLHELQKCTRSEQLAVVHALFETIDTAEASNELMERPALSEESLTDLKRRFADRDRSYDVKELMAKFAREVESATGAR